MKNADFAEELRDWAEAVIEAQKKFDELDRYNEGVWYRTHLMIEAAEAILKRGFER